MSRQRDPIVCQTSKYHRTSEHLFPGSVLNLYLMLSIRKVKAFLKSFSPCLYLLDEQSDNNWPAPSWRGVYRVARQKGNGSTMGASGKQILIFVIGLKNVWDNICYLVKIPKLFNMKERYLMKQYSLILLLFRFVCCGNSIQSFHTCHSLDCWNNPMGERRERRARLSPGQF